MKEKFIDDLYYKDTVFLKHYESFCYQNCLNIVLGLKGLSHSELYVDGSYSIIFKSRENAALKPRSDTRGLLPIAGDMISSLFFSDDTEKTFEENCRMVEEGIPVIVGVDTYYMPYAVNYQKNHASHAIILCGWDLGEKKVYVIDWYAPWFYKGCVSIDDFLMGRSSENPDDCTLYSGTPIKNNWSYLKKIHRIEADSLMADMLSLTVKNYSKDCEKGLLTGVSAVEAFMEKISVCEKSKIMLMYKDLSDVERRHEFCAEYMRSYLGYTGARDFDDCIEILLQGMSEFDILKRLIMRVAIAKNDRGRQPIIGKLLEIAETQKRIKESVFRLNDKFLLKNT